MSGSDFVASYSPVTMAAKVAKRRSLYRRTLRSAIFSLIISAAFYYWQRDTLQSSALGWMGGVYAVVVGVLAAIYLSLWRARRALGRVGQGQAFRLTARGMELGTSETGRRVDWAEIERLGAEARPGHDPHLVVVMRDSSRWSVPMNFLDALPGTIDSATRAFSGGRHGLDLSRMDSIW
ncbi:MAG TPA: hypothetical protein VLR88_02650 [Propionibacteriaceae bacterium]|nr:hypothetical protein [Propionibacteriaceae bacterium]